MTTPDDKQIEQISRHALDQSIANLDKPTLSKLEAARQRALAPPKSSWLPSFTQPWALALATIFGVAILFGKPYLAKDTSGLGTVDLPSVASISVDTNVQGHATFDDLLLLSELDDESLGLIEELDFALWLTEEMDTLIEEQDAKTSAYRIPTHVETHQAEHVQTVPILLSASFMGNNYA